MNSEQPKSRDHQSKPVDRGRSALAWAVPSPYGAPAAVESLSTVAAPLLAGFSLSVVGIILPARDDMRLFGLALLLLSAAAVLLLFSVQSGFWARHYFSTPSEAMQWWSDYETNRHRGGAVQAEQRSSYRVYRRWADRARRSYSAAIVMLLLGIGVATMPEGETASSPLQWSGAVVFTVAALGEIVWVAWASLTNGRKKRQAR